MASYYSKAGMRCAQGMPLYWERTWDFEYNSGVSRFTPQGLPATELSWEPGSLSTDPHENAATYSATASNGLRTWITAASSGEVLGAGFNGSPAESYVRCGNPEQDGTPIGTVDVPMNCTYYDPSDGSSSTYPLTFRVNTARFPYTSLAAVSAGGPARGQLVDDPDGGLLANGGVVFSSSNASSSVANFALANGTNRQSVYYMYEGKLISVNIGLDGQSLLHFCNVP